MPRLRGIAHARAPLPGRLSCFWIGGVGMRSGLSDGGSCAAAPFLMRVADLVVEVRPLYPGVRKLCSDYVLDGAAAGAANACGSACADVCDCGHAHADGASGSGGFTPGQADLSVAVTQASIEAERAMATDDRPWQDGYLETLAVLRGIADQLPQHRRLLVHGAVIQYDGRAYLFTAPSGTGKSTHIALWRQYLGSDVRVINGDKPFLHIPEDAGRPAIAYGTPWAGKEAWQENAHAPLAGIVLLSRSEPGASAIRRLDATGCLDKVLRQVYLPNNASAAATTLELLDSLLARTPLFGLACDISEDAVRTCFEAITGLPYRPAL